MLPTSKRNKNLKRILEAEKSLFLPFIFSLSLSFFSSLSWKRKFRNALSKSLKGLESIKSSQKPRSILDSALLYRKSRSLGVGGEKKIESKKKFRKKYFSSYPLLLRTIKALPLSSILTVRRKTEWKWQNQYFEQIVFRWTDFAIYFQTSFPSFFFYLYFFPPLFIFAPAMDSSSVNAGKCKATPCWCFQFRKRQ